MIPDKCSLFYGKLAQDKTEFLAGLQGRVLSIKDVPAFVCQECGEAYYTPEFSRKLDRVMEKFRESELPIHPIAAGEISLNEVCT